MPEPLPRFYITNHPSHPSFIFEQDKVQVLKHELEQSEVLQQGLGLLQDEKQSNIFWKSPSIDLLAQAYRWQKFLTDDPTLESNASEASLLGSSLE